MHRRAGAGGEARCAVVSSPIARLAKLHERKTTLLLVLLLGADLVFVALHVTYYLTPLLNTRFDLGQDGGYPEIYGYLKYLLVAVLFEAIRRDTQHNSWFAWTLVFLVFLLDDALQVHETLGGLVAAELHFSPPFNLRLQDFGELAAAAAQGFVLLAVVSWAYCRGSRTFRKVTHDMLLLVALLVFCGVFADTAHMAFEDRSLASGAVGIVEDGGEMIAASLMLWYASLLTVRGGDPGFFLLDLPPVRKRKQRRQAFE